MSAKKKNSGPYVSHVMAIDIVLLAGIIESIHDRCIANNQTGIATDLVTMQPVLVNMIGKLTLLESKVKK